MIEKNTLVIGHHGLNRLASAEGVDFMRRVLTEEGIDWYNTIAEVLYLSIGSPLPLTDENMYAVSAITEEDISRFFVCRLFFSAFLEFTLSGYTLEGYKIEGEKSLIRKIRKKEKDKARNKKWRAAHSDYPAEYRKENREDRLLYEKDYREKNKDRDREKNKIKSKKYYVENREKQIAYATDYRKGHKEEMAETKRKWYQKNKERVDAKHKAWAKANPEKVAESLRKNRIKQIAIKAKKKLRPAPATQ